MFYSTHSSFVHIKREKNISSLIGKCTKLFFHSVENSSANSNAPVCVDCSMSEEGQDKSSSKGVLLDVHYIVYHYASLLFIIGHHD